MSGVPWSQRSWSHLGLRAPKSHSLLVKILYKVDVRYFLTGFSPFSCLLLMAFLIQHFIDYFSLLTLFPVSSKQPSFPSLHSSYHDFWPCSSRLFSLHKTLDILVNGDRDNENINTLIGLQKSSVAQFNVWLLFGTPTFIPGDSGFLNYKQLLLRMLFHGLINSTTSSSEF